MKNKHAFGTVCAVALSAISILFLLLTMSNTSDFLDIFFNVIKMGVFVVIMAYTLWNYKVPHDNALRFIMLLFAMSIIAPLYSSSVRGDTGAMVLYAFAMIFIAYMAGRLNKIRKNIFVSALVLILLLVKFFVEMAGLPEAEVLQAYGISPFSIGVHSISDTFAWLALCAGYFSRYEDHKAAGMAQ